MKAKRGGSRFFRASVSKGFSLIAAAFFILCSIAAAVLTRRLENAADIGEQPLIVKTSSFTEEAILSMDSPELTDGMTIASEPTVSVVQGECFARFTVTLSDSDGTPFSDRLEEILDDAEEYKSYLENEDSASLEAFTEAYYGELNDYIMAESKCKLVFSLLCRGNGVLEAGESYEYDDLIEMAENGEIAYISGMDETLDGDLELVQITYDEKAYERQYVLKERLCAGESFSLFTNIVIPSDWENYVMNIMLYEKNDDGKFELAEQQIGCLSILGEGFGISVSTETVEAENFTDPLVAFDLAEDR